MQAVVPSTHLEAHANSLGEDSMVISNLVAMLVGVPGLVYTCWHPPVIEMLIVSFTARRSVTYVDRSVNSTYIKMVDASFFSVMIYSVHVPRNPEVKLS